MRNDTKKIRRLIENDDLSVITKTVVVDFPVNTAARSKRFKVNWLSQLYYITCIILSFA